ncbi:MAG: hypothetical protein VKL39_17085 [Leptolyngbyaceae bacterium]|nr:hypothetical protein [Leptolyngbyaceae bacterium]
MMDTQSSWVWGHQYGALLILLSVNLVLRSLNSFRGAANTLTLLAEHHSFRFPGYSSIRQWFLRLGLYELQRSRERRSDWLYVTDMTLEVGAQKCLVVLGIAQAHWQQLVCTAEGTLSYTDMDLLAVKVMSQSKGEQIQTVLEEVSERVGVPRQIVSDQGSDLYKGIRLYAQTQQTIHVTYDVTHQCARLLKAELREDETYQAFARRCTLSRQQLQQSPLSFLMPPVQRAKARYMNIDTLLEWAKRVSCYQQQQDFSLINPVHSLDTDALNALASQLPAEFLEALAPIQHQQFPHGSAFHQALRACLPDHLVRAVGPLIRQTADFGRRSFEAKLGWLSEYRDRLTPVIEILSLVRVVQEQLKHQGLTSHSTVDFLKHPQTQDNRLTSRAMAFKAKLIDYLERETHALPDDTALLASSDIIESLFGKYKLFSAKSPLKHMGHLLLSLPLLTANLSTEVVKTALETVSFDDVQQWYHQHFGQSPLAKRRQAFQPMSINTESA